MPLVSGGGLVRTNVRQCVTTDPSESVSESSTSSVIVRFLPAIMMERSTRVESNGKLRMRSRSSVSV